MKVYKIDCEWDMGFAEAYETRESAQEDINNTDWEGMCGTTLEEVQADGMVSIVEVNVR